MLRPLYSTPWCEMKYQMADWTVMVNDDKSFKVNSSALASNSRFFFDAFASYKEIAESKKSQLSRVTRINYPNLDAVQDMLDFIAKVSSTTELLSDAELIDLMSMDKLRSRLQAARHFGVPRLIDSIVSSALQNLTHSTCWEVMAVAASPDCACDLLELVAKEYALCHFYDAAKKPQFQKFIRCDQLCHLLRSDYLNAPHEFQLFEILCRWVNAKQKIRVQYFPLLLSCMRLCTLKRDQFKKICVSKLAIKTLVESNKIMELAQSGYENKDKYLKMRRCDPPIISQMLLPRLPHQAIFMSGGMEQHSSKRYFTISSAVQIFDHIGMKWVRHDKYLPAMDTRHVFSACVELNNIVYLIGGCVKPRTDRHQVTEMDYSSPLVRAYYLQQNVWRERAPLQVARHYISSCKCQGYIFAMGGQSGLNASNHAEAYNPLKNVWIQVRPMLTARTEASAASLQGLVYVCGGRAGMPFLATMEQFNPSTNQWTMMAALPVARAGLSLCIFGQVIFAMGGYIQSSYYQTVHFYNPGTNRWTLAPNMRTPRSNFASCVMYDHLYVIGGRWDAHTNRNSVLMGVERYGLNDRVWENVECQPSMAIEGACCCTIFGCELIEPLLSREKYWVE